MPDLSTTAAFLTGTAILVPVLKRHLPRSREPREILCRTGTRLLNDEERSRLILNMARAGLEIDPNFFSGIRVVVVGVYLLLTLFAVFLNPRFIIMAALAPAVYLLPGLWLHSRIRHRQQRLKSVMPDFTIMVSTALAAGINPIPALEEAAQAMDGVVGSEMKRFIKDVMSGVNFTNALNRLCIRNDVDELVNFARTLEQIYVQGAPGAETMRVYSEQMRITRKFDTMDAAGKLSVHLIFPVLIFILIPILLAIGYPAVYALMNAF